MKRHSPIPNRQQTSKSAAKYANRIYTTVPARRQERRTHLIHWTTNLDQALETLRQEHLQLQQIVEGAAARVMEEQERTQTILSALGQGLFGLDNCGCVQFLNAACERLMGWQVTELQGISVHDLLHPPHERSAPCTTYDCPLLNVLSHGKAHHIENDRFHRKDGTALPVAYFCTPVHRDGQQIGALVAFEDITQRQIAARALDAYARQVQAQNEHLHIYCRELTETQKRLEQKTQELTEKNAQIRSANKLLKGLATTDGMTGLANHRSFQETLRTAWYPGRRRSGVKRLSLMLLDVDCFKQYNDTYGHMAGDEVLKIVARLLRENMRETDLVARYGGEEFVVIAWDADPHIAYRLATRLCETIADYRFPHQRVTVSIGIATHDRREQAGDGECPAYDDPDALIKAADEALYCAKRGGRNRICMAGNLTTGRETDPD